MKRIRSKLIMVCMGFSLCMVLLAGESLAQNQESENRTNNQQTQEIKLNFRGVPLKTVLDYLSEVAGFVIVLETDIGGTVDVWSMQPLSVDEAVNLLNTILHQKGYAAIRNERILTIVSRDEARQRDIPVRTGSNPERIPRTDEMVTQVIPVRYANAMQLFENLSTLIPSYATLSANESSNALVLTDTQANIRRMTQIIQALDTSISSISTVRVFSLRHADATELANVIKELFAVQETTANRGGNMNMPPFFGGGGRGGGRRGGDDSDEGDSTALRANSRVVAVADERTNSLVVSAPSELIATIEQLVFEVDTQVEDVTVLRVFHLQNADATEMAQLLTDLFPDESNTQTSGFTPRFQGGFAGRGGQGFPAFAPGGTNQQSGTSDRQVKQTRVVAVPDPRTNSIAVSASSDLMTQIELMVMQLDSSPAKKQKVHVYSLEYADVENVAQILRNMFEQQNGINSRNTSTQNSSTFSNRTLMNDPARSNTGGFGGNQPFQ